MTKTDQISGSNKNELCYSFLHKIREDKKRSKIQLKR